MGRVDDLLFRVRWVLMVLAIIVTWVDAGGVTLPPLKLLAWFVATALVNLLLGLALQIPTLAPRLPIPSLVLDTLLFGALPFIAISRSNLLAYFLVFPTIVAAIRFGPKVGLFMATLLALALGAHFFLPLESPGSREILSTALPIVTLSATTIFAGYLTLHEKAAAVKQATAELDELRGMMAGTKLLYQTSSLVNLTLSYKPVLESMLEAGVKGLPQARREDGPPVGVALLFDDQDPEQRLIVAAARNLERRDESVRVPGRSGIIAEAFQSGNAVVFDHAGADPELSSFGALQRCRSGVCYPLRAGLELYGVVILACTAPRRPSTQHLELMQAFTSQAGIAFQNAKLYEASRKEQNRIIQSDSEMRQKLARDLHDGPTQKVAGLVMQLDYIQRLIESNPAQARKELGEARAAAQQAAKEIRTALFTLRPLALENKGLSAALEQYGRQLRESERIQIQVVPGDFGPELDANVAVTVFAIIEEAVGNALKHARQAPILVSVQRKENLLIAVVQDQGSGFDVKQVEEAYDKHTSLGLQNMRERASLINGNLTIVSAPGQGTRVTLAAPIPSRMASGIKS
jgi:signal transduction histidine kinase